MSVSSVTDSSTLSSYTSSATGNNTLGEDDFLTLLVAQLQNQDPLDPQDNTEFIAQLAQFSSLEAQTSANDKLDELIDAQSSNEQSAAFSLLGQQVIVATDNFYLQGDDLELGFNLEEAAASANLKILDEDGNTVASYSLSDLQQGDTFINWNGSDSSGAALSNGLYSLELNAYDTAGDVVTSQALVKVSVDEVALDSSGSVLVTAAGNIPLSGVSSVVAQ